VPDSTSRRRNRNHSLSNNNNNCNNLYQMQKLKCRTGNMTLYYSGRKREKIKPAED
jgi:hypothetical protein